jgi:hypothetical protein
MKGLGQERDLPPEIGVYRLHVVDTGHHHCRNRIQGGV